jgi:rhodanese-related sulfurtransferase
MATPINAARVRELVDRGAQLLEVLPRREYEEQRLPGAVGIPLKELDAAAAASLDRGAPVIVYCWDSI